jgi:hypothetical protein
MRSKIITVISIFMLLISCQISAQDFGISAKVGTLGLTFEGITSLSTDLNVRGGVSFFNYSYKGDKNTTEDYSFSADLKLSSISLLADWYLFGGTFFRLTGGALINLNKVSAKAAPTKTYYVGGDEYTPDKLGNLNIDITFQKFSPYIGIGFGNPLDGPSGLAFTVDIGSAYQGAPKTDMSAKGLLEPSAAPDQEKQLESNLSWFKWWPVVTLGFTYEF